MVFLVGCSGLRNVNHHIYVEDGSIEKAYNLEDLWNHKRNNQRINLNKVKAITIDIDKFAYNRLTDKEFQVLNECHAIEYILLIYPMGYLENDFSIELKEAFSKMNDLKEIYMKLDSADHIPNLFPENNELQNITINGNFVKELSVNTLSQKSLKNLVVKCSTNQFSFSGKDYSQLLSLSLNINGEMEELDFSGLKKLERLSLITNGKIQKLDFSGLKSLERLSIRFNGKIEKLDFSGSMKLKYLSFHNDKIEYLPNDFFEHPDLQKLIIYAPKLKKLDEKVSNLKSLESLTFMSYEVVKLPESLSKLKHLRQFSIKTIGRVISLKPLTHLPKLERLYISGFNVIEVVDEILLMKKLKFLDFTLRPLINQDLSPLGKLEKLKEIQFTTYYVERDGDNYIYKNLPDSTINEVLDQLKQVLPEHF